ncbi:MAG: hypothetical protein ACJASQ_001650 [Crocinitomicaceae bacterium]
MKKTNYFYIDESGHINNDSPIFLYGCIKTDTPILLEETLNNLKGELVEDALLREFGKKVKENNFHATGDSEAVRTAVFRLLPYMNFRYYVTVLFKSNRNYSNLYFKELKSKFQDHEIIEKLLRKIIVPRVTKNKGDINKFYFETLQVQKKSLKRILNDIFSSFPDEYDVEYFIVKKENPNIPVVDYVNFIHNKLLTHDINDDSIPDWIVRAFKVIEDKNALIHFQNDDSFYSRLGKEDRMININNINNKKAGD